MKRVRIVRMVLIVSALLLIFSAALNCMAHRRMRAEVYVHAENLNTVGIVRKLDYAIGFGKPLEKFYGLDLLLDHAMELSDNILAAEVLDREGNSIINAGTMDSSIRQSSEGEDYRLEDDGIYSFVDFGEGQIVIRLNRAQLDHDVKEYISWMAKLFASILAMITVVLLIYYLLGRKNPNPASLKQMRVLSLILLVGGQVVMGGFATVYDAVSYQDSVTQIEDAASQVVQADINEVLDKGMKYSELKKMDEYLNNLCGEIQELSHMELSEAKPEEGSQMDVYPLFLRDDSSGVVYLSAATNQDMVRNKMINHIIDTVIIIMVSIFVSLEIIVFITSHLKERAQRKEGEIYFPGFRLFVFVSGVAFSLDSGFVSVFSRQLYERMNLPDSMSFLSGMPNTLQSLSIVLGLFGCGFFISRLGTRKTLLFGIGMGVAGYVLCAVSVNLPIFIAARFVFGFCDGLVINTIRLYASSQEDPDMHNKILVTYFAAINLGICCSVVIGGLVADVSSYAIVFCLGALLGIACLFFIGFSGFSDQKGGSRMSFTGAVRQMRYRRVFIFMLFLVVPIYIAPLFVEYTFPLFGDEIGFSNSLVSGCLMLNFLIIAYLTDPISEWVNKRIRPRKAIVAYVLLQAASIGQFVFFQTAWSAILALILTSLWDCFGMVVIDSVLDDVKGTTGEQNTLLQMIFGKAGVVIGPVLVTANLSKGAAGATGTIVIILLAGVALYLVLDTLTGIKEKTRKVKG